LQLVEEPVRKQRVDNLVEQLGLGGSERKYPHELSSGMQARLALARAFASPPEVLLVDEPFANLDQLRREKLNEHLQRLRLDARCTIVMVTHDIVEAIRFSTQILVFEHDSTHLRELRTPIGLDIEDPNALPGEARNLRDKIISLIQAPEPDVIS
jgi:ABC-type nitrate/sulfonate/bicarbonate transport system ATPase subunit